MLNSKIQTCQFLDPTFESKNHDLGVQILDPKVAILRPTFWIQKRTLLDPKLAPQTPPTKNGDVAFSLGFPMKTQRCFLLFFKLWI